MECLRRTVGGYQPGIRRGWLNAVAREFQLASAISIAPDVEGIRHLILERAAAIPSPRSMPERLVLRGLSAEFAYQIGPLVHNGLHADARARCGFEPTKYVRHILATDRNDPVAALKRWVEQFFEDLKRAHVVSPIERVAAQLRSHPCATWTAERLGALVAMDPARLTRHFRQRYGQSPKEYQAVARVVRALGLVNQHKVEAVSTHVGYASKKDFYRAFVRVTGMTPSSFQSLSPQEARDVVERATLRLSHCRRVL